MSRLPPNACLEHRNQRGYYCWICLERGVLEQEKEIARLTEKEKEFGDANISLTTYVLELQAEIKKLTEENKDLEASEQKWITHAVNIEKRLQAENSRLRDALEEYGTHDRDCILSFWEAGEPTSNGGYRRKIKGKWYQYSPVDESPKCNCGFQEALASPPKKEKPNG